MNTRSINRRNRRRYGDGWYGKKGKRRIFVRALYARQGGKCVICLEHFEITKLTLDHIQPLIEGGLNKLDNMQLLCHPCHIIKDAETVEKWGGDKNIRGKLKANLTNK